MATKYTELLRPEKQMWLLTDGRVVQEPELEESPSGRRVRVKGQTNSVYSADINDIIYTAVKQMAEDDGVQPWVRLPGGTADIEASIFDTADVIQGRSAKAHISNANRSWHDATTTYFHFRHPKLPIHAILVIEGKPDTYQGKNGRQFVKAELHYQSLNAADSKHIAHSTASTSRTFPFSEYSNHDTDARQNFLDWLRDGTPEWADILGRRAFDTERQMVAALLKMLSEASSIESISIPDLRDPENPEWMELELYDTNYESSLYQELWNFLDNHPVAEKLAEHWKEMKTLLSSAGFVLGDLDTNEFSALLGGDSQAVDFDIGPAKLPDGGTDRFHQVRINLATGAVTATCSVRDFSTDEAATAWEIDKIKAEATGELSEMLAYVRLYSGKTHQRRADEVDAKHEVDLSGLTPPEDISN